MGKVNKMSGNHVWYKDPMLIVVSSHVQWWSDFPPNKAPNWRLSTIDSKKTEARIQLEELFSHHHNRAPLKRNSEDDSKLPKSSTADLLDQCFFDSLEAYQWFGIYTKESKDQNPELYKSLCGQYHDLMVENNKDPKNGSLIIRSVEELMTSEDIVMVVYQGTLIWAIRLQKQEWRWWYLYQRWWLLVHPDFRKEIAWVRLWNFLIKTINERNDDKPTYGVTKSESVINSNRDSWSESHKIDVLEAIFDGFYKEVVEARGGEDFRDMNEWEKKLDYSVTINKVLKNMLRNKEILLEYLMLNQSSMTTVNTETV